MIKLYKNQINIMVTPIEKYLLTHITIRTSHENYLRKQILRNMTGRAENK